MEKIKEYFRCYGAPPYQIAVIHGGPGTPGTMAPVARELAPHFGIIEPFQTKSSIDKLVLELKTIFDQHTKYPLILIGSSWGAMLSFIFTGRYPSLVKKLILIGSAVFEDKYVEQINSTRFSRLSSQEKHQVTALITRLNDFSVFDKNPIFLALGQIFTRTDTYDPISLDTEIIDAQYSLYQSIWNEAVAFRRSGKLLSLGSQILCPVIAYHGDYDPHPREGIEGPLSQVLSHFQMVIFDHCGHLPWIEKQAKDVFYTHLKQELQKNDL